MTAPAKANAAPRKAKAPVNPVKRGLITVIQIARRQLQLTDEDYRAILVRVTGKASSKSCTIAELEAVKADLVRQGFKPVSKAPARAGKRPMADNSFAKKCRALWLSLYHLGVVRDPSEAALTAFVKRATGGRVHGVDALQWLSGEQAYSAIEALKGWAERDGGVDWSALRGTSLAKYLDETCLERCCVVLAQWDRVQQRSAIAAPRDGLWPFCNEIVGQTGPNRYSTADWDRIIELLGRTIRSTKGTS